MMRKGLCAFSGMLFLLLSASQLQADGGFARLVIYSNGSETALAALNGPAKLQTLGRNFRGHRILSKQVTEPIDPFL